MYGTGSKHKDSPSLVLLDVFFGIFHHVHHETASQQDSRLIDTMMFITITLSQSLSFILAFAGNNIPQCTHTASIKQHARVIRNILVDPPGRKRSQDMSMCHNQHIMRSCLSTSLPNSIFMILLPNLRNNSIQAFGNLIRTFTTRTSILPNIPLVQTSLLTLFTNILGSQTLIIAIIPFSH